MTSSFQTNLTITLVAVGAIVFLLIGYNNFSFSGELEGVYNTEKRSAFISNLTPSSRLLEEGAYEIIGAMKLEPVYINLRLTRPFETLHLELIYKKPESTKLLVGPLVDKAGWRFANKSVDDHSEELTNGWLKAVIDYDMTIAQEEEENVYKLGFSSPGIAAKNLDDSIQIKEVKITLNKPPITAANFWPRLKDYLDRLF